MPELTDLSYVRALCEKYDFALSKGFGQNFIRKKLLCFLYDVELLERDNPVFMWEVYRYWKSCFPFYKSYSYAET